MLIGDAAASSTLTFNRKRPSGATAYCALEPNPAEPDVTGREPRAEERDGRARAQRATFSGPLDRGCHHPVVRRDVEQLPPIGPPARRNSAAGRDLPLASRTRKGPDIHRTAPNAKMSVRASASMPSTCSGAMY